MSQAEERLAQKLMDPNGPKLKEAVIRNEEEGRGFNKKVARLGGFEPPNSGSGDHFERFK